MCDLHINCTILQEGVGYADDDDEEHFVDIVPESENEAGDEDKEKPDKSDEDKTEPTSSEGKSAQEGWGKVEDDEPSVSSWVHRKLAKEGEKNLCREGR